MSFIFVRIAFHRFNVSFYPTFVFLPTFNLFTSFFFFFSGLWVTSQFRLRRPWSSTRFVAFSGNTSDITRANCMEVGMIFPYIVGKPVDSDQLRYVLNNVFGDGTAE